MWKSATRHSPGDNAQLGTDSKRISMSPNAITVLPSSRIEMSFDCRWAVGRDVMVTPWVQSAPSFPCKESFNLIEHTCLRVHNDPVVGSLTIRCAAVSSPALRSSSLRSQFLRLSLPGSFVNALMTTGLSSVLDQARLPFQTWRGRARHAVLRTRVSQQAPCSP